MVWPPATTAPASSIFWSPPRSISRSTASGIFADGNMHRLSAAIALPPMANTSESAFAAAIWPNSYGSEHTGGKKSVVRMTARSSVSLYTPASSCVPMPTRRFSFVILARSPRASDNFCADSFAEQPPYSTVDSRSNVMGMFPLRRKWYIIFYKDKSYHESPTISEERDDHEENRDPCGDRLRDLGFCLEKGGPLHFHANHRRGRIVHLDPVPSGYKVGINADSFHNHHRAPCGECGPRRAYGVRAAGQLPSSAHHPSLRGHGRFCRGPVDDHCRGQRQGREQPHEEHFVRVYRCDY